MSMSASHPLMLKKDHNEAIEVLQNRFGKQLSLNQTVRDQHGHTMTWLANQPPDAVLTLKDKSEVAAAVKICNGYQMPVIKSALDPKNILNPGKIWPETLPVT